MLGQYSTQLVAFNTHSQTVLFTLANRFYITYLQFKFECHACLITTFTHPSKLFVPNNVLVSLNSDNAKVYLDAQLWVFHEEIFALYTKVRLFDLKPNMAPPSRTQVSVIIPSFASD
jgi:hypothetical protein